MGSVISYDRIYKANLYCMDRRMINDGLLLRRFHKFYTAAVSACYLVWHSIFYYGTACVLYFSCAIYLCGFGLKWNQFLFSSMLDKLPSRAGWRDMLYSEHYSSFCTFPNMILRLLSCVSKIQKEVSYSGSSHTFCQRPFLPVLVPFWPPFGKVYTWDCKIVNRYF
jgi:hypothetical protein